MSHLRAKIRAEIEAEMMANPQQHGTTANVGGEGTGLADSKAAAAVTASSGK